MFKYQVELTDTFAGEANYSWVNRRTFTAPENASRATIVRLAKKALEIGWTRTRTEDYGDMLTLVFPRSRCCIAFITYVGEVG